GPEQLLGEPKSAELTGGQHDGLTVPAERNFLTLELDDVQCAHVDTGLGRGAAPASADDGRPRVLLAFVVIVIDVPGARPVRPGELQSRVLDAPECLRSVIVGQDGQALRALGLAVMDRHSRVAAGAEGLGCCAAHVCLSIESPGRCLGAGCLAVVTRRYQSTDSGA